MHGTTALGAFRRLADQIADAARRPESGSFSQDFEGVYDFDNVEFSHGDRVVIRSLNPEGKVGSGQDMETEAKAA